MSETVFSCAHLLVDAYDFSNQLTELMVNRSSESLDASTMGTTTRKHKGGVFVSSITAKGLMNLGSSLLDPVIFGGIGADATLVTAFINGIPNVACSTAGGYGLTAVSVKDPIGGSYGTLLPFEIDCQSQHNLVHSVVLDNALSSAWSTVTGGNLGTAIPLSTSGMSTSESLYGGFHVTALSTGINSLGISAVIAAASSSGFATSNTRITFAARTCKGGQWATPIASSALSTDQPFVRAVVTVATGTSTGNSANGLIWVGMQA